MLRTSKHFAIALIFGGLLTSTASAQLIGGGGQGGQNGQANRNAGLTQTGQVNAGGAVQRDTETFIGSTTNAVSHPLSIAAMSGQDGLANFGTVAGFNPNGSSTALSGGLSGALGGLTGGLGGIGGIGGIGGRNQFGQTGQLGQANGAAGTQTSIPFRLTLGFTVPRAGSPVVAARLQTRITRIPRFSTVNVTVVMDGQTAVLKGTAPSDHERTLLEGLAKLEPGVDAVRNEVRVVEASPES
jgi:hypothetical protein